MHKSRIILFASLSAALPLAAQTFSPLFTPNTTNPLTAYCLDQNNNRIPYAGYSFATGVYTNSNSHFHDDPSHPYSQPSPTYGYDTNGSGSFNLNLQTTIVGQAEAIFVTCSVNGYSVTNGYGYGVGYPAIYWNGHSEIWDLEGGTANHGDITNNHWMTSHAAYGIYYASTTYLAAHPEQGLIGANDQALPYGGKFDLNSNWQSPHITHDYGTAADMLGNGGSYSIPNQYQNEFAGYCTQQGAIEVLIESQGTSNQHIHCRWAY